MKLLLVTSMTLLCCFSLSFEGRAASIFIENYSFEEDVTPVGSFPTGGGLPSHWDTYDPGNIMSNGGNTRGVLNPNEDFFITNGGDVPLGARVPHGSNAAITWLRGAGGNTPAGLSQVLSTNLEANTDYLLTVGVGNIGSGEGDGAFAGTFYDLSGFPGYSVELWAGDNLLARDFNSLSIPEREWRTSEVRYTSGSVVELGQALEIRLVNLNIRGAENNAIEVDFDNVLLDATAFPVPEPSSFLLIGLGMVSLVLKRNRKAGCRI